MIAAIQPEARHWGPEPPTSSSKKPILSFFGWISFDCDLAFAKATSRTFLAVHLKIERVDCNSPRGEFSAFLGKPPKRQAVVELIRRAKTKNTRMILRYIFAPFGRA